MLNEQVIRDIELKHQLRKDWMHYVNEAVHYQTSAHNYNAGMGAIQYPASINYIALSDFHISSNVNKIGTSAWQQTLEQVLQHIEQQLLLADEICKSCKIDFIVILGDIFANDWYRADGLTGLEIAELAEKIGQLFAKISVPVLPVIGNHDYFTNKEIGTIDSRYFFYEKLISQCAGATLSSSYNTEATWHSTYYCDFDLLKLRCIVLDVNDSNNLAASNKIANLFHDTYQHIIFSHQDLIDKSLKDTVPSSYWGDAFNALPSNKGPVIGFHCGHCHCGGITLNTTVASTVNNPAQFQNAFSITTPSALPIIRNYSRPINSDQTMIDYITKTAYYISGDLLTSNYEIKNQEDLQKTAHIDSALNTPCFDIVNISERKQGIQPAINLYHVGVQPPTQEWNIPPQYGNYGGSSNALNSYNQIHNYFYGNIVANPFSLNNTTCTCSVSGYYPTTTQNDKGETIIVLEQYTIKNCTLELPLLLVNLPNHLHNALTDTYAANYNNEIKYYTEIFTKKDIEDGRVFTTPPDWRLVTAVTFKSITEEAST